MENQVDDENVDMEDVNASNLSDEQICAKLNDYETQIRIFSARKGYVKNKLDIEKESHNQMMETTQKLEEEIASIIEKIAFLEGKMLELLPCPVPHLSIILKLKLLRKDALSLLSAH
ncbi:hypothetical protein TNCT_260951 [Trichonephila clavata]|uniref:Uncharacterized protein n=1 Tax=Trichonephila clavata TaxID=2740835 RepID=A0A8X6H4E3_TRICU|nr:hypothetical protein TNCT_260951 [Trichonephila clavata]